jgi:hypothetical protein
MATSGPTTALAATASKDSWAEVVGLSSEEAKKKIKETLSGSIFSPSSTRVVETEQRHFFSS